MPKLTKPVGLYSNPKRKKRMQRPEQAIQVGLFDFLLPLMAAQKYRQFMAFHVPNGGKRTAFEAMMFKRMGVMAGVADIPLLFPKNPKAQYPNNYNENRDYFPRVVWVEVKVKGGRQSEGQEAFQQRVEAFGFEYHIIEVGPGDVRDAVNQMVAILRQNGAGV